MIIVKSYYLCEFSDYDEKYDPRTGDETQYYGCTHPESKGLVNLMLGRYKVCMRRNEVCPYSDKGQNRRLM